MKYLVVICDESALPVMRSATPGPTGARGWLAARVLGAIGRSPLLRWLAVPLFAIPAGFGGYSMMLHFCQDFGLASSVWGHVVAAVAGSASSLTTLARSGVLPLPQMDRLHW